VYLGKPHDTPEHAVLNFLLNEENHERFIDAVEYALKIIDFQIRDNYDYNTTVTIKQSPDAAIQEINERFKENAFGYAYQNGQIIRIDSEFIHIEAIKPVLNLLADKIYAGANQEFLSAFEHYRHKRNKEALVDALKSLESVLKAICTKRKWTYSPNDPAKRLLEVVFANNLVPDFMQSHFSSLRSMLESGVPTVRNKLGGHGQGTQVIEVPEYFVSFAINSTASTILLLVNAEKALK
jgi:hypothetical protein